MSGGLLETEEMSKKQKPGIKDDLGCLVKTQTCPGGEGRAGVKSTGLLVTVIL